MSKSRQVWTDDRPYEAKQNEPQDKLRLQTSKTTQLRSEKLPSLTYLTVKASVIFPRTACCSWVAKSCPTLYTPWTIHSLPDSWTSLPMEFPGKSTGVSCHSLFQGIFWKFPGRLRSMGYQRVGHNLVTNTSSPWGLSNPGIKPTSLVLAGSFFTTGPPGKTESESRSVLSDSLLAGRLEWVSFPFFSRGSSQPKDQTQVSCIVDRFFTSWATRKAQEYWSG